MGPVEASARAGACPGEDELAEFLAGSGSEAARDDIERHIDGCDRCGQTLALFGDAFAGRSIAHGESEPEPREAPAPTLDHDERFAGRYRIRECIGAGAGGTVYAAWDPELDRVIALKVLRGAVSGTDRAHRFTREAKVMAKVAHPNVVAVHDVGLSGQHVFIATELVDGLTLDAWLAATARSWTTVLEVFVAAGRGLAAIHETGLVHRDFKPHNVLVGHDGRVRVTDFGLARLRPDLARGEEDLVTASDTPTMSPGMLAETLATQTRTGALVGTPAYMSPEQWRGQPADARSDQFSFCVALYEALYGVRPFVGRTATLLSTAVCEQTPRVPAAAKVPRWLGRAVLRGLARRPDARFADVPALLHALTEAPRRIRARRTALALAAALVVVAGAGYAARGLQPAGVCDGDDARFAGVWDDDAKLELTTRLADSPGEIEALLPMTDDWVARWQDARVQACGYQGDDAIEQGGALLQRACLDRRFVELRASLAVVREPSVGRVPASQIIAALSQPERCLDAATLQEIEPSYGTPLARYLAEQLAFDIDRIEALRIGGRLDEALAIALGVLAQAEIDGDPALRADALLALAQVQTARKEPLLAERSLRAAVWAAEASGHVEAAADGWTELASVLGGMQERYQAGRDAAERASAALHRMHDPSRELTLAANLATMESVEGHLEAALAGHSEVLERSIALLGPEHRQVARMHLNMAAVLAKLGRFDEAAEHAAAGLAIQRAQYPGPHPVTVDMLNTVGALEANRGDNVAARAALEQALAMAELTLLDRDPTTAALLSNLGSIDIQDGQLPRAIERFERAVAIYREVNGPEHPDVALAMHNLAGARDKAGETDAAIAMYRASLAIRIRSNGADNLGTANTMHNLGLLLTGHGELDEGIGLLEHALELRERAKVDPFRRASSSFMLAKAYEKRGELARARELAERARVLLREIAPRKAEVLAAVEAWIAAHPAAAPDR